MFNFQLNTPKSQQSKQNKKLYATPTNQDYHNRPTSKCIVCTFGTNHAGSALDHSVVVIIPASRPSETV